MAKPRISMAPLLLQCLLAASALLGADGVLGLNLALMQQANPITPAHRLKALMGTVDNIKLYDYNPAYLTALQHVGCKHVVVAVPNGEMQGVAANPTAASNILGTLAPYVAAGMQFTIAVGNEPLAPFYNGAFAPYLVPALTAMETALKARGWETTVQLTVPFSYDFMAVSYPPENGVFTSSTIGTVTTVAEILANNSWPFFVNIYPYFAFVAEQVPQAYGLLETSDTIDGIFYLNLLAAQVAALRAALLRVDATLNATTLPIVVSETGWPTAGGPTANVALAAAYVNNAVAYSSTQPLYLFEAFDELDKPGAAIEGHWGLLTEDGAMKYPIPGLWSRAYPDAMSIRPPLSLPLLVAATACCVLSLD